MPKVKIEIFEGESLAATISVPAWIATSAANLMPGLAGGAPRTELDQISQMLKAPNDKAKLLDIKDHASNERVVISMVGDGD